MPTNWRKEWRPVTSAFLHHAWKYSAMVLSYSRSPVAGLHSFGVQLRANFSGTPAKAEKLAMRSRASNIITRRSRVVRELSAGTSEVLGVNRRFACAA